jgi:cytochrome c oxidase subunit 3
MEPGGTAGVVNDFARDKQVFGVPWGKAMMWIFLLSDTFIFSCFLVSYMSVRIATTDPWPNPSEVFALSFGGDPIPLILIAIRSVADHAHALVAQLQSADISPIHSHFDG